MRHGAEVEECTIENFTNSSTASKKKHHQEAQTLILTFTIDGTHCVLR